MALSSERETQQRVGATRGYPVSADAVIYKGGLVVLDGGYAAPGDEATDLIAVGRAEQSVDNTGGSDGDQVVEVREGVFMWDNSADADEITQADAGATCYVVDDETVAKTDGTGTRSAAGVVVGGNEDGSGIWVKTVL
jgi:hypothetical protein